MGVTSGVSGVAGKAPVATKAPVMGGKAPVFGGKAPVIGGKAPAVPGKAPYATKVAAVGAGKATKASKMVGAKVREAGKGKSKARERGGEKRAPVSQSVRCGLVFPVGRTHRLLKSYLLAGQRVGGTAAIYLAAAIEYLVSEVLDRAAQYARDVKVKRITQRHILYAVRSDEELDALFKGDISSAGVMPNIPKELLVRRPAKKRARPVAEMPVPEEEYGAGMMPEEME